MVKRFAEMMIVLAGIALGAQTVAAQEWSQPWARERIAKSPRHSEWGTVKHDGRNVETLIVYPESKDKRPVVVLIHEIFGSSDWVQELADEVAAAGYIAVAPDLLSGMAPNGGREAECLIALYECGTKTHRPVPFDGAGHGFMRAGEAPDASTANKKAREDSWKRWKSLLAQ